jgi:putative SOS response-associated peptidase YedK
LGLSTVQAGRRLRHQLPQLEEQPVARLAGPRACVVPASAFSEPDKNTPKGAVVWRWFERAKKQPFFFAGIWRPWTGDRGTKRAPNIGDHTLFSIMTTEPNAVVEPIHEKAMPVMLMTPDDVEQWLRGVSVDDALKMQKPAPDDAIVIRPEEKKAAERQVGNVKNNRPELMERVGLL